MSRLSFGLHAMAGGGPVGAVDALGLRKERAEVTSREKWTFASDPAWVPAESGEVGLGKF
jgi:hypothetical protein